MAELLVCSPRSLPADREVPAAVRAIEMNPANQVPTTVISRAMAAGPLPQAKISVLVGKRWPASGVRLSVSFLDSPSAALRKKILSHLNAWGKKANVNFVETKKVGEVRIARLSNPPEMAGYWSYLGTDILEIPTNEPTMNLEGFTTTTPEAEFRRVVRHEAGHTLGFPHEHMRRELVAKLDVAKTIKYFKLTQGWTADDVRAQVLTPIEDSAILGTPHADPDSIMCYQIPGSITTDGKVIPGGKDIDADDYAFAASLYPKKVKTPKKK